MVSQKSKTVFHVNTILELVFQKFQLVFQQVMWINCVEFI